MAGCEVAQLIEKVEGGIAAPKRKAAPWRKIGLAMAATATVAVATGAIAFRSRALTPVERMHRLHKGLMRAFSKRALQEAADLKASFDFTWAEEDQDSTYPMSLTATVDHKDKQLDHLEISIEFLAKEGKGADLVAQFQKVIDGAVTYAKVEGGDQEAEGIQKMVSVEQKDDGDKAVIRIKPPVPPPSPEEAEEAEQEMEESLEVKPTFKARLEFGRTLQEMFKHIDENLAILPKGIHGMVDAGFAHTLCKAAEDDMGGLPSFLDLDDIDGLKMLGGMSSSVIKSNFRYRKGHPHAFDQLPSLKESAQELASMLMSAPESIIEPAQGLADLADGLDVVTIAGLPEKYAIQVFFENFHITPLMNEMIKDIKGGGEPEGDAEPEAPPEDA